MSITATDFFGRELGQVYVVKSWPTWSEGPYSVWTFQKREQWENVREHRCTCLPLLKNPTEPLKVTQNTLPWRQRFHSAPWKCSRREPLGLASPGTRSDFVNSWGQPPCLRPHDHSQSHIWKQQQLLWAELLFTWHSLQSTRCICHQVITLSR